MLNKSKLVLMLCAILITSCDTFDVVEKTSVYPKTDNLFECSRNAIDDDGVYEVDPLSVRFGMAFEVSDKKSMSFKVSLNDKPATSQDQQSETDILRMTVIQGPGLRMHCEGAENYKTFMRDVENIIQQYCGIELIESDFEAGCKK